jgi:hypothetical protein
MDAGFERHAGYHTTMLGLAVGTPPTVPQKKRVWMQGLSGMRDITPQCWGWRGDIANGISKKRVWMQGVSGMRYFTPQCWGCRGDTANGTSKKKGMVAGFERHAGYHTTMLGLAWGHRQRYRVW